MSVPEDQSEAWPLSAATSIALRDGNTAGTTLLVLTLKELVLAEVYTLYVVPTGHRLPWCCLRQTVSAMP